MTRIIKSYRCSLLYLCNTSLVSQRAPRRNWPRVYGSQGHRSIPIQWITLPEHVIRTAWVRFIGMGPLSELAVPLEQVHPNPVNNLAGTRHSDRTGRVIRSARIRFIDMGPLSELALSYIVILWLPGYPRMFRQPQHDTVIVIHFFSVEIVVSPSL